ncbi:hypothetical protein AVEN_253013-1 [Araneus ventricosus]|uniref:DUF7041 domain-containing protein n=1 Tax=Araneus ventricosus TaxID=182803 RepID=A0A4Y2EYH1_ARAVE|nr:hypothetical protein AVEN_253013-1 [Araneus ventricosus]
MLTTGKVTSPNSTEGTRIDPKFDYLCAGLDHETVLHVRDIVCELPPHPYTALKSRLLTEFEVSQNKKLKTLNEYLELGNRSPSVLLRQMRDLTQIAILVCSKLATNLS